MKRLANALTALTFLTIAAAVWSLAGPVGLAFFIVTSSSMTMGYYS